MCAYYHYTEKSIIVNLSSLANIFIAVGVIRRATQELNMLTIHIVAFDHFTAMGMKRNKKSCN